jgi:Fe2+ or Zn2+ uptake regulation protein
MRNSKQRNLVLEIVKKSHSHISADAVYSEARKIINNISLGTVYRNLGQLVNNDLLKSIIINGVLHYDANSSNHQHFYCSSCNKVFDMEIDTKKFVYEINGTTDHVIKDCHVHLYGICEKCQKN